MSGEITHGSVRSAFSLERELEIDFSNVRLSGRSLNIQQTPVQPELEAGLSTVLELSDKAIERSRLNVNKKPIPEIQTGSAALNTTPLQIDKTV